MMTRDKPSYSEDDMRVMVASGLDYWIGRKNGMFDAEAVGYRIKVNDVGNIDVRGPNGEIYKIVCVRFR